jgi:hypothetical protein
MYQAGTGAGHIPSRNEGAKQTGMGFSFSYGMRYSKEISRCRRLSLSRHALTEQEAFINYISNSDIYRYGLPLFMVFLGT